jgi:hypothetical protein
MRNRALLLVVAATLTASPAYALTVVDSQKIASDLSPNITAVSFARFDSSLGTLNSVTLAFEADLSGSGTLRNKSATTKDFAVMNNAAAGLSGNGFTLSAALLSGSQPVPHVPGKHPPGERLGAAVPLSFTGHATDAETLFASLDDFVGSGGLINFSFTRSSAFDVSPSDAVLTVDAPSIWGKATLAYDYTPFAIASASAAPEPGAWAMMIAGFFGLGGVLRRRRRQGLAAA